MKNKQLEQQVNRSFSEVTPDVYEQVREKCAYTNQYAAEPAPAPKRHRGLFWKLATCALAIMLVVGAIWGGVSSHNETASAATISLDVNPSVEIKVNKKQRVLSVKALNDEGKDIIGTMDFKGSQLEVTVNALIGSMFRKGYISDYANSVLVSVDASDKMYSQIVEKITSEIQVVLKEEKIDPSILIQKIKSDDAINALVKKYGISAGKAQLIHQIAQNSTEYTEEQLVLLSVNDLNLILTSLGNSTGVSQSGGSASDKSYVGTDSALEIALEKLGMEGLTAASDGLNVYKNRLEFAQGTMVYEIQFSYGAYNYGVAVGALSGKVLAFECEKVGDYNPSSDQEKLSQQQILQKALQMAAVSQDAVEEISDQAEMERNRYYRIEVYTVYFVYDNFYYEYDVDCYGNVLYSYNLALEESDDDSYLTRYQVEEYFRKNNKEGFSQLDALERFRVVSKSDESGKLVYEISFIKSGIQYFYTVDALTRQIVLVSATEYQDIVEDVIKDKFDDPGHHGWGWDDIWDDMWEDDHHGNGSFGGGQPQQQGQLSQDEVKEIVFWFADVRNESYVSDWQCKLKSDHGMAAYEVHFVYDGVRYEIKVNAQSGAIMRYDYKFVR